MSDRRPEPPTERVRQPHPDEEPAPPGRARDVEEAEPGRPADTRASEEGTASPRPRSDEAPPGGPGTSGPPADVDTGEPSELD